MSTASDPTRPDPEPPLKGDVLTGDGRVSAYSWEWSNVAGPAGSRRLPWIGIFLLVFGALLLLRQALPGLATAGSLVVLAVGIALLIKWALDRSLLALYGGAVITALGLPDLLSAAGIASGPGLGTLLVGVAFLAIAGIRAASGGGVGWQAYLGLILAIVGGAQVVVPALGGLVLPALLVIGGLYLVARTSRTSTA
jgi:hypothetical protein